MALVLTFLAVEVALAGRVGPFSDVGFVLLCVVVALRVRPTDFFTAGVLPPLVMLLGVLVVAVGRPAAIGGPDDGLTRLVVAGLSHHAAALGTGYGLCLACLAVRQRFVSGL